MPFPPKTLTVHRKSDPVGEMTVVNASDFDADTMEMPGEPIAAPEKTEEKPEPAQKKAPAKRGRPPGAKNKPRS